MAWSYASQGYEDPKLVSAITNAVAPVASELSFMDASMLTWSLAASRHPSPCHILDSIADGLRGRASTGSPHSWATLLWSFASLQHDAPHMFEEVMIHMVLPLP